MRPFHLHAYKTNIWWSAKSGCSSIKHIAHRLLLKDDRPIHKDTWDLNPACLFYTNILIVRDPKTRLVACYLDKYDWWKEQMFEKQDYTFHQFINWLLEHKSLPAEHHYAKQFEEAFVGVELLYMHEFHHRFHFDYVYKLEEINWEHFLRQHFQYQLMEPIPILHETKKNSLYVLTNASEMIKPLLKNTQNEYPNYSCFFTPEIVEKIHNIYKKDYDYFAQYNILYP